MPPGSAQRRAVHRPTAGVRVPWWAVLVAVIVLVVVVVELRTDGPLVGLDHRIAARISVWGLRRHAATRWGLTVAVWFGQRGVVLVGAALIGLGVTWRTRTWEPLLRLLVAVIALAAVVYGFKFALARTAPGQDGRGLATGHGASFPSGHIANAILLWGWADWAVRRWPAPEWLRRAIRAGRWVAPFAVFVAMILLNYHWLSDLIGGAAVGVILLAFDLWPGWSRLAGRIDARWPVLAPARGRRSRT